MCEWGTTVPMEVTVPACLSHTGQERQAVKPIDACLASLVATLNEGGLRTTCSCCGHGRALPLVSYLEADGTERHLVIFDDLAEAIAVTFQERSSAIPTRHDRDA